MNFNEPTAFGPQIGSYLRRPIWEWLEYRDGIFKYDRPCMLNGDGVFEPDKLGNDEMVIFPGLIYKKGK